MQTIDRRLFLGGAAALALPRMSLAQDEAAPAAPGTKFLSHKIADFVAGFDLKAAPPLAIERTRVAFVDTVGVMLAGSKLPAAQIVCDMVREEGSAPQVAIVGQSLRASPQFAAMANAVAAHTMDYDFSYIQGQMVAPLVPALLPLAEKTGATPAETLAAFMAGFEVASRLGRAAPTLATKGGWHSLSTAGTIGNAAACARLLKLPASAIPDVLGIAVSMAGGVGANYGTMTKPMHSGLAARNGILAAQLGGRGYSSNPAAIEGRDGYFGTFMRGLEVKLDAFDDLGRVSDIAERGYSLKLYPCGGQSHTAIDSALALRDTLSPRLADIASIKVGVTAYGAKRIRTDYPVSSENAKFSMPYLVAYSLIHGAPLIAAFEEKALDDQKVRALAKVVSLTTDPEFADLVGVAPARLVVTFKDGTTVERVRQFASGTVKAPLTSAQIDEKFLACAAEAVDRPTATKLLATLRTLGDQPSFGEFWTQVARA